MRFTRLFFFLIARLVSGSLGRGKAEEIQNEIAISTEVSVRSRSRLSCFAGARPKGLMPTEHALQGVVEEAFSNGELCLATKREVFFSSKGRLGT